MSMTDENVTDQQQPAEQPLNDDLATPSNEARRAIEALLMVSDEPVAPTILAQLTELSLVNVERICIELAAQYEADERGFILVKVAGGWRFQSHPDMAPYIERYVLDGKTARLSAAALETLAIIAYKQPISRAQVASIRGVNVDAVVRTLQARGYVEEVGKDPGPGQASMFGTTADFLERLGLDSLDDLPPLGEFIPGADVYEQLERSLRAEAPPAAVAEDAEVAVRPPEAQESEGDRAAMIVDESAAGTEPEAAPPGGE